jgi:hypothetical protein
MNNPFRTGDWQYSFFTCRINVRNPSLGGGSSFRRIKNKPLGLLYCTRGGFVHCFTLAILMP